MNINKEFLVIFIFAAAVVLRLMLLDTAHHSDLLSLAAWSERIFYYGPKDFYESEGWIFSEPTQPPLASLLYGFLYRVYDFLVWLFSHIALTIATYRLAPTYFLWWFDFVKWFGTDFFEVSPFKSGIVMVIKSAAILADLAIALILYILARKKSLKLALILTSLYLFLPFSFYLSSIWGQYDQLSFLFLLLALLSLTSRKLILATALFFISISIKPTSLIFSPFFLWVYFVKKPKITEIFLSIIFIIVAFIITTTPFTNKNLIEYSYHTLRTKIFYKSEYRVGVSALNFWRIIVGNKAVNQNETLVIFPYKIYAWILFALINIFAFKITIKPTMRNVFMGAFIIGMGGWLFLMNMMERYAFSGVTLALFLTIYYPKVLKYAVSLGILYWVNLYHNWWVPQFFDPLRIILVWNEGLIPRVLSVVNVVIFFRIMRK